MPYASNRDRAPGLLELESTPWPAPPLNLFLTSGYVPGVFDLSWSDPADLALNANFDLMGVNLYRSFDSEFGPFERLTELPIGSMFWRDQTDNALEEEVVQESAWVLRGDSTGDVHAPRYVFHTERRPIVQSGSQAVVAKLPSDVEVFVDGQKATVLRVDGASGQIEIDARAYPEVGTQKLTPAVLPTTSSTTVVVYRYNRNFLKTDLSQRVFYRITSVGTKTGNTELLETPLEHATATSNFEMEKIDWVWREGVRRNGWLLAQGGERVKVFLRKHAGASCVCRREDYKQPLGDCLVCFGTGFVGGYEGPFDLIIAPDDGERSIRREASGVSVSHSYEVWTGPQPLLRQQDFIVKINGERYSIGGIRSPNPRGMILQQHFTIGHIEEKDIRYRVPVDNPMRYALNQLQAQVPPGHGPSQTTDKPNIPDERELQGRTRVWENNTY